MSLSPGSEIKLKSCDPKLISLIRIVAVHVPLIVLEGHRDEIEQQRAFDSHRSKLAWPHSKHNPEPSHAVDIAPSPYNPRDLRALLCFGGYVLGIAAATGVKLRWGGSWTSLPNPVDPLKDFSDLFHFELEV